MKDILAQIENLNVRVSICRSHYSYTDADERWGCLLEWKGDGQSVETNASAPDMERALTLAWDKFRKFANNGLDLPQLTGPVITTSYEAKPPLDSDIPF